MSFLSFLLLLILFPTPLIKHSLASGSVSAQPQFSIRFTPDSANTNKVIVEVSGLDGATIEQLQRSNWKLPEWQRLLSIYADPSGSTNAQNLPPMLGAYRIQSGRLRFEPQYPLEPGILYRAIFRPDQLPRKGESKSAPILAVFQLPPPNSTPDTVVTRIYPSADLLPENLLKFYIHFSAPMSRGDIYNHIHLLNSAGKEVELPFLEIGEELWDPTMTRLTLLIDPGRIKRGVLPLEDIGPALEAGKSYTLLIGDEWRDAAGKRLKEGFQKKFQVSPPDREPPDPSKWKIEPPKSQTRDRLIVTFSDPMDHALAERVIRVLGESGAPVEGQVILEDQERRWTFTPNKPWIRGAYRLVAQTTIEDLAGNNIGKPFDVDLFEGIQRRLEAATVKLPFEVR